MSKVIINFKNTTNQSTIIEFCKKYHIEYQVLDDVSLPSGIDESAPVKEEPKAKASKQAKSRLDAKDVDVAITVKKSVATIPSVSRDTFAVLKNDASALNGEWDKEAKGFKFSGKGATANAKKFAERTVVTADERNAVRKDWGWA